MTDVGKLSSCNRAPWHESYDVKKDKFCATHLKAQPCGVCLNAIGDAGRGKLEAFYGSDCSVATLRAAGILVTGPQGEKTLWGSAATVTEDQYREVLAEMFPEDPAPKTTTPVEWKMAPAHEQQAALAEDYSDSQGVGLHHRKTQAHVAISRYLRGASWSYSETHNLYSLQDRTSAQLIQLRSEGARGYAFFGAGHGNICHARDIEYAKRVAEAIAVAYRTAPILPNGMTIIGAEGGGLIGSEGGALHVTTADGEQHPLTDLNGAGGICLAADVETHGLGYVTFRHAVGKGFRQTLLAIHTQLPTFSGSHWVRRAGTIVRLQHALASNCSSLRRGWNADRGAYSLKVLVMGRACSVDITPDGVFRARVTGCAERSGTFASGLGTGRRMLVCEAILLASVVGTSAIYGAGLQDCLSRHIQSDANGWRSASNRALVLADNVRSLNLFGTDIVFGSDEVLHWRKSVATYALQMHMMETGRA